MPTDRLPSAETRHLAALLAADGVATPPDRDRAMQTARDLLADQSRAAPDRIAAGFALGRANERCGAYDDAFAAYAIANRLLRAEHNARGTVFNHAGFSDLVDHLIATIGATAITETAAWGDPSELPVFIVGMPRSGTSLIEQIAASHPLVFGAGELKDIPRIITLLGNGRWDRASVRRECRTHLRRLRQLGGDAVRVIDKLPDNIGGLGRIAMLFPHARIVVCRRDLRDVCLSCFFQYFAETTMLWTNDLSDCGFRAREVDRLLRHWRQVVPNPILELHYEALIANQEAETRRLIEFLGLQWDPACLSFQTTQRTVTTASHWQVKQPLYTTSVGRWKHYRQHLGPLLAELAGTGGSGPQSSTTAASHPPQIVRHRGQH